MWIAAFGDNVEIESAPFYHSGVTTPQLGPNTISGHNEHWAMQYGTGAGGANWRETLHILHFYVLTGNINIQVDSFIQIYWHNIIIMIGK